MFSLPDLPYGYGALAPVMSEKTLHLHHDKHHAAYVKKLNGILEEKGKSPTSLEAVIREASGSDAKLFDNAAQAWNHAFFWVAMSPDREAPAGDLAAAIEAFGGMATLKEAFVTEGANHFASGWVWITADAGGGLKVASTHDADSMAVRAGVTPLMVCDLWEHAYYLDYQNDRKAYLETWFDALPNWTFAAAQLAAAKAGKTPWRYPAPSSDAGAAAKAA